VCRIKKLKKGQGSTMGCRAIKKIIIITTIFGSDYTIKDWGAKKNFLGPTPCEKFERCSY
jgi:hypothetical protein